MAQRHRTLWAMVGVVLLLLSMVEDSVQLSRHRVVQNSYIGLVMAYPTEEAVLRNSGYFIPSSTIPWLDLAGRRFNLGTIKGVDVIYVMTGEQTMNAAITVQILLDSFDVKGIVHYGIAGSANDSLSIGDVSVPSSFAFTSSWKWKNTLELKSERGQYPDMKFGDFDIPNRGENLLGKVEFTPYQLYSPRKPMEQVFWLPVDSKWFDISTKLRDVRLEECVDSIHCLPKAPKVVYGLRGSTADVYLENAAYREFLFAQFNVSTVDEESAAVVMTCLSNGVPCIVFRGVSDMAGSVVRTTGTLRSLAALNALIVAVDFISLFNSLNVS